MNAAIRSSIAILAASSLIVAACGTTPSSPTPAAIATAGPAPASVGPSGLPTPADSGPVATDPPADPGTPSLPPPVAPAPLPSPTLTEPFAVGQALYDPTHMADGVVSLLKLMGVGIYAADGAPIRRGDEHSDLDLWLSEPEVRGLISEGIADLTSGDGQTLPYTVADLHRALHPLLPDLTLEAMVKAYASSYEAHPDALVPQVMLGQPIEATTPITRVQFWLLFADGFVKPANGTAARSGTVVAAAGRGWGTASTALPRLPAGTSGMSPTEFALWVERIQTAGYGVALMGVTTVGHEGHGGLGSPILLVGTIADTFYLQSPFTGAPLYPTAPPPLGGIPITLTLEDPGAWSEHGTLPGGPVLSLRTAGSGIVTAHFTPKREVANGEGDVTVDDVWFHMSARKADVVSAYFQLPVGPASVAGFLIGDMRSDATPVYIVWHTKDGLKITLTDRWEVQVGLRSTIGIGDASGSGTDRITGFLPRRDSGIYRGSMNATNIDSADCQFLGSAFKDVNVQFHQHLDVLAQVQHGVAEAGLDRPVLGAFGESSAQLSFYPDGPPSDDGKCLGSVKSPGGGPLQRGSESNPLTYTWFADSRVTDPNLGYRVMLPEQDVIHYYDNRFSAEGLNGPGGLDGVDTTWEVTVEVIGQGP